ncbi:MAG: autotransporter-associated beta strand repeat-containing protein [Planctomycetota bacterium]
MFRLRSFVQSVASPATRFRLMRLGLVTGLAGILAVASNGHGAVVTLTADDAMGTTSFNASGHWSNGQAPSSGNTYVATGHTLRTPQTSLNYDFQGDSLTLNGRSWLAFKGASGTAITIDNLTLDNGGVAAYSGNTTFTLAGSIVLNSGGGNFGGVAKSTAVIASAISGSGNVVIESTDTIRFTGSNSYSGNTAVNSGVLQLGANNVLPFGTNAGDLVFGSDGTNNPATLDMNGNNAQINGLSGGSNAVVDNASAGGSVMLTVGNNSATSTFDGVIKNTTGTIGLTKTGSGKLTLTGVNTYARGTTVIGGMIVAQDASANGSTVAGLGTGAITLSGGTVAINRVNFGYLANGITLSADSTVAVLQNQINIIGSVTGSGGSHVLTKTGTGTLYLNSYAPQVSSIVVEQGYLGADGGSSGVVKDSSNWGGSGVSVNIANGAGVMTFKNPTISNPLVFQGGNGINNQGALVVYGDSTFAGPITLNGITGFGTVGGNMTVSGSISGSGGLVVLGGNTLTLTGLNTYTGPTVITAGTLKLASVSAPAGAVAYYSFDDVAGGTANNGGSGGLGMNGILTGGAAVVNGGHEGNCLSLNGNAGSYVNINSGITSLSGSATYTIAAWVKTSTPGASLLYKGDLSWNPGDQTFYLSQGNGSSGTRMGAVQNGAPPNGGYVTGNTSVNDGSWHFVAISRTGGVSTVYVDGHTDGASGNMNGKEQGGQHIRLGWSPGNDGSVPFNGWMDEFYVYGIALNAAQIELLYNSGNSPANLLPTTTPLSISVAGVFDLGGISQQIASLSGAGTVMNSATATACTFTVGDSSSTAFAGTISDSGLVGGRIHLTKIGAGTLTLTGSNTYSGGTTISAGRVVALDTEGFFGTVHALGLSPVALAGGELAVDRVICGGFVYNNITITADSAFGVLENQVNLVGTITTSAGNHTLTKTGSGTLFMNSENPQLAAIVVQTGGLGADGGPNGVVADSSNWGGSGVTVTVANGACVKTYRDPTLTNPLVFAGGNGPSGQGALCNDGGGDSAFTGPIILNGTTGFGTGGGNVRISGVISGSGGLTVLGGNTLTLTGSNTYTGTTTVSSGTLQVTGSLANNGSDKLLVGKDADGVFDNGNGDASITRRVTASATYAGLGSSITNLASGELSTAADMLAGNSSTQADVTMAWRTRSAAEKTQVGGGLISEVLDLSGVALNGTGTHNGSHQTDWFVLQMNYDPASLLNIWGLTETDAITQHRLYLGSLDMGEDGFLGGMGVNADHWINAVDGNFGGTTNYLGNQPYNSNLLALGNYGVNTANHTVWAVLDHNSEFAVVPEPSSLVLLGIGGIGMAGWAWRRRQKHSLFAASQDNSPAILSMPSRWTEPARRAA